MTGSWHRGVARVRGTRVVVAGIAASLVELARTSGADVAAAVLVPPAGAPLPREVATLTLPGGPRSTVDLQVGGAASVLERHAAEVGAFLDGVDPSREACVIGSLAVPHHVFGGRAAWAPDAALARRLEAKRLAGAVLDGVVPWMPSVAAPAVPDRAWWEATLATWGASRAVAQHAGLNAAGSATTVCRDAAELARVVAEAPAGVRVAPYRAGTTVNVTGIVARDGSVAVLPPTRQLLVDRDGHPAYAGNVCGEPWTWQTPGVVDGARRAGEALAAMGYAGPYGLDAIVDAAGRPWFHDLNARTNGAVHLLNLLAPVLAGVVFHPAWLDARTAAAAERELHRAARARPLARWWLSRTVAHDAAVPPSPPAGWYRLDPRSLRVEPEHPPAGAVLAGNLVRFLPRSVPGTALLAGDVLDYGDVYCAAGLADELAAARRDRAAPADVV